MSRRPINLTGFGSEDCHGTGSSSSTSSPSKTSRFRNHTSLFGNRNSKHGETKKKSSKIQILILLGVLAVGALSMTTSQLNSLIVSDGQQQQQQIQTQQQNTGISMSSSATASSSCSSHVVQLYPSQFSLGPASSSHLCGQPFYPLDFIVKNDIPSSYNWKNTGLDYYAAGIGLHHVTFDDDDANNGSSSSSRRHHNLIYNSMMKCGSTSVNRALKELAKSTKERFLSSTSTDNMMKVTYQGKQNNLLVKDSQDLMQQLYDYQQQQQQTQKVAASSTTSTTPTSPTTFEYFTTVRDPVRRFVSAIAQEMYIRRNDPKATEFREKCLLETPQQTLQCSIDHVKQQFQANTLDQPHFIPMTTILYKRSYGYNVSVTLLDIVQVDALVRYMVAPVPSYESNTDLDAVLKKNPLKAQGSDVLKNMTVSDLNQDMIHDICNVLYPLDVQMMKGAGFPTLCV